jgi:hypothetical protein
MFAELDVVRFVLNEIDAWEGFVAKDDPHLGRIIETGKKVFSLNYFDWGQAQMLASKLNGPIRDQDIMAEISKYHSVRKTQEEKEYLFEEQLAHLLRATALVVSPLCGACEYCIDLHAQEDLSRFKPMLSQVS